MELIEKRPARQALGGSNAAITSTDSTYSISTTNLLKGVEKSNKKGNFLLDSSKIVDENGEPIVVYHNTNDDFNIFSRSELGKRTTWASNKWGFATTPSASYASGYGKKQMSLYVRVTNPKRLSWKEYERIVNEGDEGFR